MLRLGRICHLASRVRELHTSIASWLPVVQFKLSDIGEGIAEVQVKEWHIKVGDRVSQFDNLCEVQSDKASVTITSRYDGIVKKLHYNVDDVAKVGQPLMDIEVDGAAEDSAADEQPKKAATSEPESKPAPTSSPTSAQKEVCPHSAAAAGSGKALATPAVRRIAVENKVNLSKVRGSGREGRVLKEDVLAHIGQLDQSTVVQGSKNIRYSPPTGPIPSTPAVAKIYAPLTEDKIIPIRGYTRAMVKTMTEALKIPHFGYNDEYNVDELVKMRTELKDYAKERGIKLSYMPFFIKAASLALLEHPSLNAQTDAALENVIHKATHNVCLAMDTPGGLVVPNIKNCEQRSVFEIAQELNRLHEAGKRQQIAREDLLDGTFSLSNIGAIGGTYASPVCFPPQVAIGAIGKIEKLPRFDKNGNVYPANLIKFSWSADHRVVDGATMARFSETMRRFVEKPSTMLVHLK